MASGSMIENDKKQLLDKFNETKQLLKHWRNKAKGT